MRKRRILASVLSAFMLFGTSFAATACDNEEEQAPQTENSQDGKLVADFETFRDCTANMLFNNFFGRFEINTDKKYVTNGNASLKVNPQGDQYQNNGLPNMHVMLGEDERDISKLKRVTFDIFNDTDHDYTIGVYFLIGNNRVSSPSTTTKIVLPQGEWTNAAMSIDMPTFSMCNDPTETYTVAIEFETCFDKDKKNDLYVDNLRFSYTDEVSTPVAIELDDNEFCSFDKLYQRNVVTSNLYSAMTDYDFYLELNSDLRYSRSGKSLKMHVPKAPVGQNWGWANVQFAEALVKAVDFAQYDDNATFSFWVYNDSTENIYLSIDFWRTSGNGKRSFTKMAYVGWNHITLTFAEINEDDGGIDKMTDTFSVLRICSWAPQNGDVDFYFDSFEIIPAATSSN